MPVPRGVFALLVSFLLSSASFAAALPPGLVSAAVSWPPSAGFVVAEVVTGGASASDEYVEISNVGSNKADLGGLELVYVSASGATITRKAVFASPLPVVPGGHLLVANSAGIYAPLADATYSGGLAADGGAVALRRADGTVVDTVGWGTAANSYVEGSAALAPPAKSSIERLPGGSAGNTQDTNDNKSDWFVQSSPVPQSLASTPAPMPTPTPTPTAAPTSTPSIESEPTQIDSATPAPPPAATDSTDPADTPGATESPSHTPTADPTAPPPTPTPKEPTATDPATTEPPATEPPASPAPTPAPTSAPTAASTPTPAASPSPTPAPSAAEPAVDLASIAAARALAPGTRVHVAGVVTVGAGLLGTDGLIAMQDSSGGIFVRLATADATLPIGRSIEVEGTLSAPYGQLEIRQLDRLIAGEVDKEPAAARRELDEIGESTEGSLVTIRGTVDSIGTDAGRVTITIGDGVSAIRALADPAAAVSRSDVARGDEVLATGIVGQHATATGRPDGYRIWLRRPTDLVVRDPLLTDTPDPTAGPTAAPTAGPTATVHHDLASALGTRGAAVDVDAAVTATAGLFDIGGTTIVVDDGTAAVAVILTDEMAVPPVGMLVRVTGKVGRWEGGPTVIATAIAARGELEAVVPATIAGALDATLEWQLVKVCGRIERYTPAGSRWRLDVNVSGNLVAVLGEPDAAIDVASSDAGRLALVVGIVRRSTSDPAVFQLLPRSALDFHMGPAPATSETAASGSVTPQAAVTGAKPAQVGPPAGTVEIGSLVTHIGERVTVAGLVTDTTTTTATVDDGTGSVVIGGAAAAEALSMLEPGDAIEVTGLVLHDDSGLALEADPDSIVALPGSRGGVPIATSASTATTAATQPRAGTAASSAPPIGSSVAGNAARMATSHSETPDLAILLTVLLLALAAVAGVLAAATRSSRLRRRAVQAGRSRCTALSEGPLRRLRGAGKDR